MFLAIAKTDLYSDLDLKVKEREMVVNMLVIGRQLGNFLGLYFRFVLLQEFARTAVIFPPQ